VGTKHNLKLWSLCASHEGGHEGRNKANSVSLCRPQCVSRRPRLAWCAIHRGAIWHRETVLAAPQASVAGVSKPASIPTSTGEQLETAEPTTPEGVPPAQEDTARNGNRAAARNRANGATKRRRIRRMGDKNDKDVAPLESPLLVVTKPLPRVLMLHTGGTLGMDPTASYEAHGDGVGLKRGTGGVYAGNVRLIPENRV
jgi:hypothetical protein